MSRLLFNMIGNCQVTARQEDGGANIFTELARAMYLSGADVTVFATPERIALDRIAGLDVKHVVWRSWHCLARVGVYALYMTRTLSASLKVIAMPSVKAPDVAVYSGSDFWPDSIPGFLMSRKIRGAKWIAAMYLVAPNPFSRNSPYRGRRFLTGILYYLSQRPVYWLMKRYAAMVLVTSEPDRQAFLSKRLGQEEVIAVMGGIDTRAHEAVPEPEYKDYDAVFVGRFHPQKGVLELIDIWKYVTEMRPGARLAMIGVGVLEGEVRSRISRYHLEDSIALLGFQTGVPKYKIFKASRIVLHPATYDSGGFAACEAMVCGLPGVSFDLESLRTYYPKGMLKTPCFDFKGFADNVVRLLEDHELFLKTRKDAVDWAMEWAWEKRMEPIVEAIGRVAGSADRGGVQSGVLRTMGQTKG